MSVKRYVMAAAMGEAIAFPQGPGTAADAWAGSIAAEETATEFILASDYVALAARVARLEKALRLNDAALANHPNGDTRSDEDINLTYAALRGAEP